MVPAKYPNQCPYVCKSGTYIMETSCIDTTPPTNSPCDPTINEYCPTDTFCSIDQPVRMCAMGTGMMCEPAEYVLEEVVYNVGGSDVPVVMTIASAHTGSILYITRDAAVYAMSTFQRQKDLSLAPIDGTTGMTLVAGNPSIVGRVDATLGSSARFYRINSMMLAEGGIKLWIIDTQYVNSVPMGGWLRFIDITTRDYPVSTLSAVKPSPVVCANDTFVNPASVDVLYGTPNVLIADAECLTLHTYNMNTGKFLRTAGSFYSEGTGVAADGNCLNGIGLLGYLIVASWTSDGSIFVIEAQGGIRKVSYPNTPSCIITTVNTDGSIPWPGEFSLEFFAPFQL